jgi:aspartate kinase
MALIVQKFGGTSVADPDARDHLISKVKQARDRGDRVVLVVSAIGRRGAPYATDTLLEILRDYDPMPDPMIKDLLASSCETISACLIATLLRTHDLPAVPMTAYTAGIFAQGPYGDAVPTGVDTRPILDHLDRNWIPVITGFQALNPAHSVVTLGRGGSDTSAVAVGAALDADFVDIYTDVPGVAKADPRVIPDATYMAFLDHASMFRLAKHGAKVLHDRSALLAEQSGVLLRVRSTFDDGEGTLIGPKGTLDRQGSHYLIPDFIGLAFMRNPDGSRKITAVFAEGRGERGIQVAQDAAQLFQAERIPLDDADAMSFCCAAGSFPEFANSLYARLDNAFAIAGKKTQG